MSRPIPSGTRLLVMERAGFRCEYCRLHMDNSFLPFEVDHIASRKHGGGNELENLALACPHCNQNKGSDLTTFLEYYDDIVPLFNPRKQVWEQHFSVDDGLILPKTRIAEGTIKLLKLNEPERIVLRQILRETGDYPF